MDWNEAFLSPSTNVLFYGKMMQPSATVHCEGFHRGAEWATCNGQARQSGLVIVGQIDWLLHTCTEDGQVEKLTEHRRTQGPQTDLQTADYIYSVA